MSLLHELVLLASPILLFIIICPHPPNTLLNAKYLSDFSCPWNLCKYYSFWPRILLSPQTLAKTFLTPSHCPGSSSYPTFLILENCIWIFLLLRCFMYYVVLVFFPICSFTSCSLQHVEILTPTTLQHVTIFEYKGL